MRRRPPAAFDAATARIENRRMKIEVDDLTGREIAEFLSAHVHQMRTITPIEAAYALDLEELRKPDITFWAVRDGDDLVGCGALKELTPTHGEIKSMRTDPARTRAGIASRLLEHIIGVARDRGYTRLSLETGTDEFFLPARNLYGRFGFTTCEPFGDYTPSPHNTFMAKQL
jgi:putative acetyltransferase